VCHEASDISVAGEGVAVLFHGFLSMYLATTFFLTGLFSLSLFSLIILAHDMMERRLDDYVRLMTKGEKTRRLKERKLELQERLLKGHNVVFTEVSWETATVSIDKTQ
jgi:hypothetical protein